MYPIDNYILLLLLFNPQGSVSIAFPREWRGRDSERNVMTRTHFGWLRPGRLGVDLQPRLVPWTGIKLGPLGWRPDALTERPEQRCRQGNARRSPPRLPAPFTARCAGRSLPRRPVSGRPPAGPVCAPLPLRRLPGSETSSRAGAAWERVCHLTVFSFSLSAIPVPPGVRMRAGASVLLNQPQRVWWPGLGPFGPCPRSGRVSAPRGRARGPARLAGWPRPAVPAAGSAAVTVRLPASPARCLAA